MVEGDVNVVSLRCGWGLWVEGKGNYGGEKNVGGAYIVGSAVVSCRFMFGGRKRFGFHGVWCVLWIHMVADIRFMACDYGMKYVV